MEKVSLIITGAGGRVGRLLDSIWKQRPPDNIEILRCGRGDEFDYNWDIIRDPVPNWPSDAIVLHLAGAVRGDLEALAINAKMIAPLCEACQKNQVRHLFFASTVAVYPLSDEVLVESVAPDPINDYGAAKWAAEQVLAACTVSKTVLRIANIAGADSLLSQRSSTQAIDLDPVLGRSGGPLRSWIGPITLANVLLNLISQAAQSTALPSVLNIASGPPLYMADVLDASQKTWRYGAYNSNVVPQVVVCNDLLTKISKISLIITPQSLIEETALVFS